jgi:antitoxin ParD1/3/4
MPTRNVVLTDHQAELIEELVASGRYQTARVVWRAGGPHSAARDAEEKVRLQALREAARVGIAYSEAGRFATFDDPAELARHVTGLAEETTANSRKRPRRR